MITAIPMNEDRIANHFTKANYLAFFDEQGIEINCIANPALTGSCEGKRQMLELLTQQQVNRVVVRNIGERMLAKLLDRDFIVYQTHSGRRLVSELVNPIANGLIELNQANQGRESLNYTKKSQSQMTEAARIKKTNQKHCCSSKEQSDCSHSHHQSKGHGGCCHF